MVELLAPAGTPDALRAAVAAGADAVYVGLGAFNARAANGGFSLGELARGCVLAHAHGARVYVTLNACFYDDELRAALELASAALEAGADALIVADMGMCALIREELPQAEVHLSTQAGAQCVDAVRFAARELRVDRVTCARELSVAELGELCREGVPIEAFCHGAICICYSGACSYSALMRGRSANRGDCAQPCRLAYELQDKEGRVLAGGAWEPARGSGASALGESRGTACDGDRLLCPRDYLGIRHVGEMIRAGVSSFKIEGRMKAPDYVYNVVRCYRQAIDAALAGEDLGEEADRLEAQLARSFSRGFTDGYLVGDQPATGAGLMSFERAINQGLEVGRVVEPAFEGAHVTFLRDVAAGDMLEIRSTPGTDAPADVPKRWPIVPCPADVRAGERAFVRCKRKVEAGSAVHVVRSESVLAEARSAVEAMRIEEDGLLAGMIGAPGEEGPLERGGRCAHARRGSELACGGSARVPHRAGDASGMDVRRHAGGSPQESCSGAASLGGAAGSSAAADRSVIDLGEVCRARDLDAVRRACEAVARGERDAVLCRNIGQLELVREAGVPWEAGAPLNVWNALSAKLLQEAGARRIWMPEELGARAFERMVEAAREAGVEIPLAPEPAGSTPLMIMEHCLLTAEGPCAHTCRTCPRRLASERGERFLMELDRNSAGARLAVRVDELGRTRLYR